MLRWSSGAARKFALAAIALSAAGCSAVDSTLSTRVYTVNQTVETARNEAVLLNIVRASRSHPLHFLGVSSITGTTTVDLKTGLPTLTFGPSQTTTQHQFAFGTTGAGASGSILDTSGSAGFGLNILDTKDFYKALLTDVTVSEIDLLIHQGFPRELLYFLLVDAIRVQSADGHQYEFRNDPADDKWTLDLNTSVPRAQQCVDLTAERDPRTHWTGYDPPMGTDVWRGIHERDCAFQKFKYFVALGIYYGLTTISVIPTAAPKAAARPGAKAGGGGGGGGGGAAGGDEGGDAKPKPAEGHFCFDPAIADQAAVPRFGMLQLNLSPCDPDRRSGKGHSFSISFPGGAKLDFQLRLRSAYSVFRYLGSMIRDDTVDRVVLPINPAEPPNMYPTRQLLVVTKSLGGGCFAQVSYYMNSYCVPLDKSVYTKMTFSVITQLIALNTSVGDIPVTTNVRVIQ